MKKMILPLFLLLSATTLFAMSETTNFSFASDDHHNGPTFTSPGGDQIYGRARVDLMVDVNEDLGGGQVTFQSEFKFEGRTYDYMVIPCGSAWLHIWKIQGAFVFSHFSLPGNPGLLEVSFEEGVLTALSPSDTYIIETMTLQVNRPSDQTLTFTPFPLLGCVIQTPLQESLDLAFTFTNLHGLSQPQIDINNGAWLDEWQAEGSFSASGQ